MKARELIERLQQLDPEVEITHEEWDFEYGVIMRFEIKDVSEGGYLNYGKIIESRDMSNLEEDEDYDEDYDQETEEA